MKAFNTENQPERVMAIPIDDVQLEGQLVIPENARGIVLITYDCDSHQQCTHIGYITHVLHQIGLATLLIDLLTPEEEVIDLRTRHFRRNVDLLADRLVQATDWMVQDPAIRHLKIGYFGACSGASAALVAATERAGAVSAIVSEYGQLDLLGSSLFQLQAPTLLIAGGSDPLILDMNQYALMQIPAETQLVIIPGTSYSCEDIVALETVAQLTSQWFDKYLGVLN
jgi:putative phosphoribosyl transferase